MFVFSARKLIAWQIRMECVLNRICDFDYDHMRSPPIKSRLAAAQMPTSYKLYSNLVISSDKICQCERGECIKYLQCVVLGEVQDQVLKPIVCHTVQIVFNRFSPYC